MADIAFLKHRVHDAIVSDIVDVARFHSERNDRVEFGGCLSVPREVFCMVDFLGAVAYADDASRNENGASSRKAAQFLEEYFPDGYKPFATLIVHMWRHGTVHNFQPLTYTATVDGRPATITWTSNNGSEPHNKAVHLRLLDVAGSPGTMNLAVNVCALAGDLVASLDTFVNALEKDDALRQACLQRLEALLQPRQIESLPKAGERLKALLEEQIRDSQAATSGTLRGTQVE